MTRAARLQYGPMRRWVCVLLLVGLPALAGPLIVLDPGHGGSQEGAASPAGLKEK
ncbi:MAG: hypothetical protein H6Q89_2023, partial [Myxococcaceae bacterium]|nr:hypothetical protein [Myxococcaceae bacterium]